MTHQFTRAKRSGVRLGTQPPAKESHMSESERGQPMGIGLQLTPAEWKELWMLLYNVVGNNLVSPYVGPVRDNVRGPLQLARGSDDETVLDPLGLEELLRLDSVLGRLTAILFPTVKEQESGMIDVESLRGRA